jgi:Transposase IS116/IS110/IS902 family
LTCVFGVGPILAAKIIGEVGNVARFPTKAHFASYTGTQLPSRPQAAGWYATGSRERATASSKLCPVYDRHLPRRATTPKDEPTTGASSPRASRLRRKHSGASSGESPMPSTSSCAPTRKEQSQSQLDTEGPRSYLALLTSSSESRILATRGEESMAERLVSLVSLE